MTVHTQQDNTKYFIYARKSTEDEERQRLSIPAQIDELRSFAKKKGLIIVDSLIESKTAKKPGRKIFNSLIERIQLGEASGILSWHPDRLARNAVDAGIIIHLLDTEKLVDLKFPTVSFENNPNGKFMLSIAFGTSKYYVDNLSINTKRGLIAKAKRGFYPGLAPIGYRNKLVNGRKIIVVDKKAAKVATKAFKLFSKGTYTLKYIAEYLASKGIVTKPNHLGKGNKPFKTEQIRNMLKNPFYYGDFKYSGEMYEGKHKPLISKKLFDRVQKVIKKRCWRYYQKPDSNKRKYNWFAFSGLIKCGECGYYITNQTKTKQYKSGKSQSFTYYHCTKKSKTQKCSQGYVRQESALNDLLNICQKVSLPVNKGNWLLERLSKDEQKKQDQLSQVKAKLTHQLTSLNTKLSKLLTMHLDNLIDREEYLTQKNQLMSSKKTIEENLINLADYQLDNVTKAKDFVRLTIQAGKISAKYLKTLQNYKNQLTETNLNSNRLESVGNNSGSFPKTSGFQNSRIEPNKNTLSRLKATPTDSLVSDLAGFLKKAELNLMLKEQKVYHIKQNPWAALCAAAPSRNLEPRSGFEPETPNLPCSCSGQLSYLGNNLLLY